MNPLDARLSAHASLPADELAVLRRALADLLAHRPDLRGAAVYPVARGEAIVRIFTSGGWVPTLLTAGDRRDADALLARLEAALAEVDGC